MSEASYPLAVVVSDYITTPCSAINIRHCSIYINLHPTMRWLHPIPPMQPVIIYISMRREGCPFISYNNTWVVGLYKIWLEDMAIPPFPEFLD